MVRDGESSCSEKNGVLKILHLLRFVCHFFVLITFWRHLWSIAAQTHGNMSSIFVNFKRAAMWTIGLPVLDVFTYSRVLLILFLFSASVHIYFRDQQWTPYCFSFSSKDLVNCFVFTVEENSTSRSAYFMRRENKLLEGHLVKRLEWDSLVSCGQFCLGNALYIPLTLSLSPDRMAEELVNWTNTAPSTLAASCTSNKESFFQCFRR